jgi:uncharacterized protein YqeY
MTRSIPDPDEPARSIRTRLRDDLVVAMKQRRRDDVAALRTLLAEIDNAEAVDPVPHPTDDSTRHVAGARHGAGSSEAVRASLTAADIRRILEHHVDEHLADADDHERGGHDESAARLRARADLLRRYLPDP